MRNSLPVVLSHNHGEPPPATFRTGLTGTHFWDCSGGGCDATTLQPWDPSKYLYAAAYPPLDPDEHGGAVYGESLWMTGAASAQLAELLGSDNACCGRDVNDAVSGVGAGGCGKCILVKNPSALSPQTTAIVMKKNFCPAGANSSCDLPKVHMDLTVPGFGFLSASASNICGASGTIITQAESSTCGDWFTRASNVRDGCDCSTLQDTTPAGALLRSGCELFRAWGWTSGNPALEYQVVECPTQYVNLIQAAFIATGPATISSLPSSGPLASLPSPIPLVVAAATRHTNRLHAVCLGRIRGHRDCTSHLYRRRCRYSRGPFLLTTVYASNSWYDES